MKPFQLSDPATAELTHAIRWYEQQRTGLGGESSLSLSSEGRPWTPAGRFLNLRCDLPQ